MADVIHLTKAEKVPREPNTIVLMVKVQGKKFGSKRLKLSGQIVRNVPMSDVQKAIEECVADESFERIYVVGQQEGLSYLRDQLRKLKR
jgi:hypothetical protein